MKQKKKSFISNRLVHPPPPCQHLHPPTLCPFSVCFLLEANCDWLIKTITEITKSNQVWTFASYRYVDHLEFRLDGLGIRPNCCGVDKSKTLKLKARSIQVPLWVARRRLNQKIMVRKKNKNEPTCNINYLAALRTVREISAWYISTYFSDSSVDHITYAWSCFSFSSIFTFLSTVFLSFTFRPA